LKNVYLFLIKYYKIFYPKFPFYEKVRMTTKRIAIFESFVIVGSFDYDRTCYAFWQKTLVMGFINPSLTWFLVVSPKDGFAL
jgi:hypothetical protein